MSWIDRVNEGNIVITTGGGETFDCLFKRPSIQHDFKAVALEYYNTTGAKVVRPKRGMRIYSVELYFQGDNHLDEAARFMEAAENKNPWILRHPYYSEEIINCQPTKLTQGNEVDNITVFKGELWETNDLPDIANSVINASTVAKLMEQWMLQLAEEMGANVDAGSAATIGNVTGKTGLKSKIGAVTDFDLGEINQAVAKTNRYLNTIGTEPALFMRQVATLLRAPSKFYATINKRIDILKESANDLKLAATGVSSIAEKTYYGLAGGMNLLAQGEALITTQESIAEAQAIVDPVTDDFVKPVESLRTRSSILKQAEDLINEHNSYIAKLSELQSEKDNRLDSYFPSPETINVISEGISLVLGNIYTIAANAVQERTYVLPHDMQILVLMNKLSIEDEEAFVENNSIPQDEIIVVKKGRTVTYYV